MRALERWIERLAGLLLGAVAVVTVLEVVLRQAFGMRIPDAYSLAGYLQGTAVFWGIAVALMAGRHITVDLLWQAASPRKRRWMDIVATVIAGLFFVAAAWMMLLKVLRARGSFESTLELGWPIWPLLLAGALGGVFAVFAALVRLRHLRAGSEEESPA